MRIPLTTIAILSSLIGARAEADTDDKTAAAVKQALDDDRRARREQEDLDRKAREVREANEARYNKEAITFNDVTVATVRNGTVQSIGSTQVAFRNGRKLSTTEFYDAVDRPDLSSTYRRRGIAGWSLFLTGTAVALAGAAYSLRGLANKNPCDPFAPDFSTCFDREQDRANAERSRNLKIGLVMVGGGLALEIAALVVFMKRHPTTANEGHDLADRHNAKLRQKYGLPAAGLTRPKIRNVAWAPYATPDGGGVAMVGRF